MTSNLPDWNDDEAVVRWARPGCYVLEDWALARRQIPAVREMEALHNPAFANPTSAKCCWLDCDHAAEWQIHDGPKHDDYTLACVAHVGRLLGAAPIQFVYPFNPHTAVPPEMPAAVADVDGQRSDGAAARRWQVESVKTNFGDSLTIRSEEHLVLVCTNNGSGWRPRVLRLPHQIYKQDIEKWFKEDSSIAEVVSFPVKHDSFTTLWGSSASRESSPAEETVLEWALGQQVDALLAKVEAQHAELSAARGELHILRESEKHRLELISAQPAPAHHDVAQGLADALEGLIAASSGIPAEDEFSEYALTRAQAVLAALAAWKAVAR